MGNTARLGLVVSIGLLLICSAGMAGTLNVPGSYGSIQAAVTAAVAGDTIQVSGGPYTENVAINDAGHSRSGLTIQGSGVTINGGFYIAASGSPSTTNVTIDGFTINGGYPTGGHFAGVVVAATGHTIKNCIIKNVVGSQSRAIETVAGANNLTVEGCQILSSNVNGPYLNPSSGVIFRRNYLEKGIGSDGLTNFLAEYNIFNGASFGCGPGGSNITLNHNDFINNTGRAVTWYKEGSATGDFNAENNWWGSVNGPSDALGTVEVAAGDSDPGAGSALNTAPSGALGAIVSDSDSNWNAQAGTNHIDYIPWVGSPNCVNLAVANVQGGIGQTVDLMATLTGATSPAGKSVTFWVDNVLVPSSPVLTDNDGVATVSYAIALALGDHVIKAQFPGDAENFPAVGYGKLTVPQPSVVWVDDSWTGPTDCGGHSWGYDAFKVIQQGVNAVAVGGTVNVAAGTYADPVSVSKSLSLLGAQHGSTPVPGGRGGIAGESRIDATGWKYRQINVTADDVTVDGFMFDSCHEAINCTIVRSLHKNVTISSNYFVGASSNAAVSLMPNGGVASTFRNFTISNNLIDFTGSAKGINLSAGATPPYIYDGLNIEDNVVKCANYGLFAGGVVANFEVHDAVISGNTFECPSGVNIAKLKNPSITDNTFSKVTGSAISVGAEGGTVSGNTVVGGTAVPSGTGINVYGGQYGSYLGGGLQVTDNDISMAAIGIQLRGGVDGASVNGNTMTDCTVGLLLAANGTPLIATVASGTDITDNTIDGAGEAGFAIVGITGPADEVDLGSSSIAAGYTNFVTLTNTPVNVNARSATFSGATDDAAKEAKVYHDVDDAALGHVDWGQGAAVACSLVASDVSGAVGQTVQLSAKLTSGGTPLAGQGVTFAVDDVAAGTGTTDGAGVAAVPYGPLTIGDKTITAKFSGVSPYKATTGTATLTVAAAAPTAITLTVDPSSVASGGAVTCTVLGDNDVDYTDACTYYVQYGAGGSWANNVYTSGKAGTWNVTAVYNTLADSKPLTVTAGAAASVALTPATATINPDATQEYSVTATDAAGNTWTPAAGDITWAEDGAGSFTGYVYTPDEAGDAGNTVTITATVDGVTSNEASLNVNAATGAGAILAWDKDTRRFYLCSNASDPQTGTEITGSGDYGGIAVTVNGTGTNVTVSAGGASLRVMWYLRGGSLYKAYQYSTGTSAGSKTATYDGRRTLVDGSWKTGFWGLTHTIDAGTASYGSAQQ